MKKIFTIIFIVICCNAEQKYIYSNGKSFEIADPYNFKGEILNIYNYDNYQLLYIKDERGLIIKGKTNITSKNNNYLDHQINNINKRGYIKGNKYNFNCRNFNDFEFELCK